MGGFTGLCGNSSYSDVPCWLLSLRKRAQRVVRYACLTLDGMISMRILSPAPGWCGETGQTIALVSTEAV